MSTQRSTRGIPYAVARLLDAIVFPTTHLRHALLRRRAQARGNVYVVKTAGVRVRGRVAGTSIRGAG